MKDYPWKFDQRCKEKKTYKNIGLLEYFETRCTCFSMYNYASAPLSLQKFDLVCQFDVQFIVLF